MVKPPQAITQESTQEALSRIESKHRWNLSAITIAGSYLIIFIVTLVPLVRSQFNSDSGQAESMINAINGLAKRLPGEDDIKWAARTKEVSEMRAREIDWFAKKQTSEHENLKWLTTATFPMLGAWIGTVLTFYFAGGASRAVNEGYQKLLQDANSKVGLVSGGAGLEKLKHLQLSSQVNGLTFYESDDTVSLAKVKERFAAAAPRKRLLLLNNGSYQDIIILSELESFLVNPDPSSANLDIGSSVTINDYLQRRPHSPDHQVEFAPPTESVYDPYVRMLNKKISNLIVTENGKGDGKVLAFLTCADIEELSR